MVLLRHRPPVVRAQRVHGIPRAPWHGAGAWSHPLKTIRVCSLERRRQECTAQVVARECQHTSATHIGGFRWQVTRLTRAEWSMIRASLGKPRRLSLPFLREERQKLENYRKDVRAAYQRMVPSQVRHLAPNRDPTNSNENSCISLLQNCHSPPLCALLSCKDPKCTRFCPTLCSTGCAQRGRLPRAVPALPAAAARGATRDGATPTHALCARRTGG